MARTICTQLHCDVNSVVLSLVWLIFLMQQIHLPNLSSPKLPQPIFLPTRKFGPTINIPDELTECLVTGYNPLEGLAVAPAVFVPPPPLLVSMTSVRPPAAAAPLQIKKKPNEKWNVCGKYLGNTQIELLLIMWNGMLKCNNYMVNVNLKYKQINSQWIHIILKDFFTL